MKKLLIITPIKHIEGCYEKLSMIKDCSLIYLPDCTKNQFLKNKDANYIFTNPNKSKIILDKNTLKSFNDLEVICTASTGTNHIDKEFLKFQNIKLISLTNERFLINKITSTAEHAFCLTLGALRNLIPSQNSVLQGQWDYEPFVGRQISELTVGVIGYGRLGTYYSHYCDAFGAEVLVYDPYKNVPHTSIKQINYLDELFIRCDIISIHVHVSQETKKLISWNLLEKAKKNLLLVNTSRGDIVDEEALLNFLMKNQDSKYATDVLCDELEGVHDNKLRLFAQNSNQLIITPHIAGMTVEGQSLAFNHAANLLLDFCENI